MSECNHDCNSCKESCSEKKNNFQTKSNELSCVKKVIGVVSGKGGVGKSLVSAMLAVSFNRQGYVSAVLDGDITGPSIPKMFGVKGRAEANDLGLFPKKTTSGIEIMSINLLLENDTDPVVWRGPVLAGMIKQFWSDVVWGDVDYMFVDMPPGTGDVPLTVFQSLPIDGIVIVTSPQEMVSMIVTKAIKMANLMNVPIIGIIENMSYVACPDCDKKIHIFGESKIEEVAKNNNLEVLATLPINPKLAQACDKGAIELFEQSEIDSAVEKILSFTKEK